jgi:hypothetical protein
MTTTLNSEPNTQVLVHSYHPSRNIYIVSKVAPDEISDGFGFSFLTRRNNQSMIDIPSVQSDLEWISISPDDLAPTTAAKFYPVLESLMERAEQAAEATSRILRSDATKRLVDGAGNILQVRANQIQEQLGVNAEDIWKKATLEDLASTVESAKPAIEDNFKQVLTILKNDELTVLFARCKERLEQLVQSDLSATTKMALKRTGIHIQLDEKDSWAGSIEASRKAALADIDQLLKQAEIEDLEQVRGEITSKFTSTFDSLAHAARSDRGLNDIFATITEKTTEWQEASGKLMATRSASLFLEGASRIQARAVAIFQKSDFQWAGEIGSKLTKSFTEGDAALARLKSIELGETVKNKLVEAIEVRSESLGGLDGIIAGALASVKSHSSSNQIADLLKSLQRTSTAVSVDSHETLISVLSSQSTFRDFALLRIEQALCELGDQIGGELAPEEIAAIVRGEGGTAKIFQPIANRAMKEIEKQLDNAESQVKDENVVEVLKRIRKIMSGELTLNAIMDDIVNVLNDENVVAVGESFIQQSEQVLDAIEGVSGNKAVADAIQIAEKAGITKDTLIQEFEKLKVDDILEVAGDALSDEKARRKLLSSATDAALDFVLKILPSIPVPPFEGVKDGLLYHISNLSLQGFRVRKEDVAIELAGMKATKRSHNARQSPPSRNENKCQLDSPLKRKTQSLDSDFSAESNGMDFDVQDIHSSVKATELLIVDIRNISAVLENAHWSFEQTYLPYLKGEGDANVTLSGGAIKLQFELRKRRKEALNDNDVTDWEPVLCLHDRSCEIDEVNLTFDGGGSITWIINKLASVFKGPLRDYVVLTIVRVLTNHSGWILERLNTILSPYWDLLLRTAHLQMDGLVETDESVVVAATASNKDMRVELVWRERLPLGMNLLMNDDSGILKVVDFPRGSQARSVAERRGLDPELFKGASILAVNGFEYTDQEELFDALKDPSRPKTVEFELAESEDLERLRRFLEKGQSQTVSPPRTLRAFNFRKVLFHEPGELGIEFGSTLDNVGLEVRRFVEGEGGVILAAERSGQIKIGDLLTHVNDIPAINVDGSVRASAIELLESVANIRPLSLSFVNPFLHYVKIQKPVEEPSIKSNGGPNELILDEIKDTNGRRKIRVVAFRDISGRAESGGVLIGDHLVFINGLPVGAGCRWLGTPSAPSVEEVFRMLSNESFYPVGLTFARPRKQKGSRWMIGQSEILTDSEADTFCVTSDEQEQIGCILEQVNRTDIVVTDFLAVAGVLQRSLAHCKDTTGEICLTIEAINGQFVPSYASAEMVNNALVRSWKSDASIDLLLSDETLKNWLFANMLSPNWP